MSKVTNIKTSEDIQKRLFQDFPKDKLILLLFSASWCKRCKSIFPDFQALSEKYTNVEFLVIDIDELSSWSEVKTILGVPTFQFYLNKDLVAQVTDVVIAEVEKRIQDFLSPREETPKVIKLTDDLAFGKQPSEDELRSLSSSGIKSVVNMRETWEKGFLNNEQEIVESQGLKYHLAPIDEANDFTKEYADSLLSKMEELPKPVFVHCNVGLTAAVASLLWVGKKMNVDADQILAWGSDLGFNFAFHAKLYEFLNQYMKK
eukprot:TRINITY_DN240_c0_g1_i1.p1 TRINITY_DN240_c0_g1~~TRINITY_DN240_c0_g1_i1.p1  ORF type:complete len:260 (+),score=61.42 TRINITY_DN240_c0_g1_i1:307-1086(+)